MLSLDNFLSLLIEIPLILQSHKYPSYSRRLLDGDIHS